MKTQVDDLHDPEMAGFYSIMFKTYFKNATASPDAKQIVICETIPIEYLNYVIVTDVMSN